MERLPSLALALSLLPGCAALGPTYVEQSRGAYIEVLAQTDREELLSNLVRLRYLEAPVFMQIDGITAAPSLELGAEADISVGAGPTSQEILKPRVVYKEAPTIVYKPLLGQEFARELLVPIGLVPILLLVQNGWSLDQALPILLASVNGFPNLDSADRESFFRPIVDALSALQKRRQIRLGTPLAGTTTVNDELRLTITPEGLATDEGRFLVDVLGLDATLESYKLRFGLQGAPDAIAVETRPLLAIMANLAQSVAIPEVHRADGIALGEVALRSAYEPPMRVQATAARPADAFVAVRHRGYWYSIADSDLRSKSAFLLLRLLFNLQAQKSTDDSRLQLTLPIR